MPCNGPESWVVSFGHVSATLIPHSNVVLMPGLVALIAGHYCAMESCHFHSTERGG